MKSTVRAALVFFAFSAVGCVSDADVAQVGAAAPVETSLVFGDMHASIPASRTDGNVFEYN